MAALCDLDANGDARVAAQWSYEPYGDVIAAEHNIEAFPVQTLGHKGLFLNRLDNETNGPMSLGGSEAHRLVPFAHSLYHNRNRAYAPSLGRFLQQDPNQTAMSLLEGSYHGSAMGAAALSYSLEELYGDGMSLYQYVGSSPVSNSDPTGLFVGYDDLLMVGAGALRGGVEGMIGQYAENQNMDLDWATNWDTDDDWHSCSSNSWAELSFAMGFYAGLIEQVQDALMMKELEGLIVARARGGKGGGKLTESGARSVSGMSQLSDRHVYDSYYKARKGFDRHPGEGAHHLVERQMDGPWRRNTAGGGPAINVEARYHRSDIRVRFNEANRRYGGPRGLSKENAKKVVRYVYLGAPNLRKAAIDYIVGK